MLFIITMKLKDILTYVPGIQIPLMISEHVRGMKRLVESWEGYQTSVRRSHLVEIVNLEAQREVVPKEELPAIDRLLSYHKKTYVQALTP